MRTPIRLAIRCERQCDCHRKRGRCKEPAAVVWTPNQGDGLAMCARCWDASRDKDDPTMEELRFDARFKAADAPLTPSPGDPEKGWKIMAAKKHKPGAADAPLTPPPIDSDGLAMVEVEPGRWIGLPTFDINEWFDSCEIPPEERAGILERGGGYDGFQVSPELERETFQWLHDHGRPAVSARTPLLSDETMEKAVRRFDRKQPGEKEFLEHLERLDIRDKLQRQAEVKAWGQSEPDKGGIGKSQPKDVNDAK